MWIIRMAWKNLWRNRTRTLITVAAVFFAVILSTLAESLKKGVFDNLVRNVVSFYTGSIQVHRSGYQDEQVLDNGFQAPPGLETAIRGNGNIRTLTARLEAFALAVSDETTRGCMISGIDPAAEDSITSLRNKLISGQYLSGADQSVLLTEGLADRLKLQTGDTVILLGQGYHGATAAGKFRVKGILKFGSPQLNEKLLFMSLRAAQEFLAADGILTSYILSLENDRELNTTSGSLKERIGDGYEVRTWEELLPDIRQHISTDAKNMKLVQGVLYLLICFGIFSTLLMMMLERKFEMGMLVAIGMKKSKLAFLLVTESVLTVLTGCVSGLLAAIPLILYLERNPIRMSGETARAYEKFGFEAIFPAAADPSIFLNQALVILLLGLGLSFYPVIKVIRLRPVEAMKK